MCFDGDAKGQAAPRAAMPMTDSLRSHIMSQIHSRDTKPELLVRRRLWRDGFRFRVNVRSLPGTPDVVLGKYRTAIFVNGCFWHGHRACGSYTVPKTNTEFWDGKIRRNVRRDAVNAELLEAYGWRVVTVWECELKPKRLEATMAALEERIRDNGMDWEAERQARAVSREGRRQMALEAKERGRRALAELGVSIPPRVIRDSLSEE